MTDDTDQLPVVQALETSAENHARLYGRFAIDQLALIAAGKKGAKARDMVAAATALLDRGHGKPTQAVISVPMRTAQRAALAGMSTHDLLVAIGEARMKGGGGYGGRPRNGDPTVEVRDACVGRSAEETSPIASRPLQFADSNVIDAEFDELEEDYGSTDVSDEMPIDPLAL
jgi:hypothetical protein